MRTDIDSILLANWYLTMCRLKGNSTHCKKTELARKYLVAKINKVLFERAKKSLTQNTLIYAIK